MRLNKYLAHSGVASRRHSDDLIVAGRVAVNGEIIQSLGVIVQPDSDQVTVDGQAIQPVTDKCYYILNKPRGYLTTVSDPFNRETVMHLIKGIPFRVFPVGRLDCDSEGLLLFTNDGNLSNELIHPRYGVDKEYRVLVQGHPDQVAINRLRRGIQLDDRMTSPCQVEIQGQEKNTTWLTIILHEGRKRQIRHMCDAIGHPVVRLLRVRFGPILLDQLISGQWRALRASEIRILKQCLEPV